MRKLQERKEAEARRAEAEKQRQIAAKQEEIERQRAVEARDEQERRQQEQELKEAAARLQQEKEREEAMRREAEQQEARIKEEKEKLEVSGDSPSSGFKGRCAVNGLWEDFMCLIDVLEYVDEGLELDARLETNSLKSELVRFLYAKLCFHFKYPIHTRLLSGAVFF